MSKIKCTDEQIIEASMTTDSARQASIKLGIKYDTYKRHALRLGCFKTNQSGKGLPKKKKHRIGYEFNDYYFDSLDNIEQAYFLGFIAADGSVNDYSLRFYLNRRDRMILEMFCCILGYSVDHIVDYMSYYIDDNNVKHEFPACRVQFSSKHLVESLKKYNIIPNKSNVDIDLFSLVPNHLKIAWLVGYIDGDGHVGSHIKSGSRLDLTGNYSTLQSVSRYLANYCDIGDGFLYQIGDITYTLTYYRKHELVKLVVLYCFGSDLHLDRKYKSACDILRRYSRSGVHACVSDDKENETMLKKRKCVVSKNTCMDCGCIISVNALRCRTCALKELQYCDRPDRNTLKNLIRTVSFLEIGKIYGVSDNAVRKWCKRYGLPHKRYDIDLISDVDWNNI